jgi:hypothetical protein
LDLFVSGPEDAWEDVFLEEADILDALPFPSRTHVGGEPSPRR